MNPSLAFLASSALTFLISTNNPTINKEPESAQPSSSWTDLDIANSFRCGALFIVAQPQILTSDPDVLSAGEKLLKARNCDRYLDIAKEHPEE